MAVETLVSEQRKKNAVLLSEYNSDLKLKKLSGSFLACSLENCTSGNASGYKHLFSSIYVQKKKKDGIFLTNFQCGRIGMPREPSNSPVCGRRGVTFSPESASATARAWSQRVVERRRRRSSRTPPTTTSAFSTAPRTAPPPPPVSSSPEPIAGGPSTAAAQGPGRHGDTGRGLTGE